MCSRALFSGAFSWPAPLTLPPRPASSLIGRGSSRPREHVCPVERLVHLSHPQSRPDTTPEGGRTRTRIAQPVYPLTLHSYLTAAARRGPQ